MNDAMLPLGHPNRRGGPLDSNPEAYWKLDPIRAYIIHSTANLNPGTGDEWHGRYFGRAWKLGDASNPGPFEADGKTPFRRGLTHVAFDAGSGTQYLPFDEYAAGAGDRNSPPWTPGLKGQTRLARDGYGNRQNWCTLQAEICEGGGWDDLAASRAASWVIEDALARNLAVDLAESLHPELVLGPPAPGRVWIHRHHDLTGKNCPAYFVRNPSKWADFVHYIAAAVNRGQP